ncbi:MAG: helix-turn-helix transcriptional regulator [Alphaproteobacteria bacterium]|nr:helix-turn-helix transcriptional regulator [Alphaproteobacteria bacterium]
MDKKREKLQSAIRLLKLLSHPVRLSILCNLHHRGEMSVGEIVEAEGGVAGQSQISQFLKKMRTENLVTHRKKAQTVYYKISSPQVKKVIESLYKIYCSRHK